MTTLNTPKNLAGSKGHMLENKIKCPVEEIGNHSVIP